jgi:hypothetical protein
MGFVQGGTWELSTSGTSKFSMAGELEQYRTPVNQRKSLDGHLEIA